MTGDKIISLFHRIHEARANFNDAVAQPMGTRHYLDRVQDAEAKLLIASEQGTRLFATPNKKAVTNV